MTTFAASMEIFKNDIRPFVAKTFSGLEEELATELKIFGAENVEVIKRGVKFEGNKEVLYRANYLARTAIRILTPVTEFKVTDEQSLYDGVKAINWSEIMTHKQTFVMSSDVFHSQIDHSLFASLKAKDALVDHFREKIRRRPSVDKENADIYINVHISHNVCTISLDSSGESLHKRGYRIGADKAPLNEVLAAGLIKLSGWKGDVDFYDPMCGSGTIVIEAAMLAMNIPAGYYRKSYAFEKWPDFDEELWKSIKEEHDQDFKDIDINIVASDRSEKAVQIAKRNLKHAGLHKDIEISKAYFDSIQPKNDKGLLLFNPPYGMRLEENDIIKLYQGIGDVLKSNWAGHQAWIITSAMDAAKFIGLRPTRKIELYNGPIEAKLLRFDVYEGSKREKAHQKNNSNNRWDDKRSGGRTRYVSNPHHESNHEDEYDKQQSDRSSYRDRNRDDNRPSRGVSRYDNKDNRGRWHEGSDDKRHSDRSSYRDKRRDDDRPSRGGSRYSDKDNRDSRYKGGGDKRRSDSSSYRDKRRDDDRPSRGGSRYGDKDNRGSRYEGSGDKRRSDSSSYRDKRRDDDRPSRGGSRYGDKDNRDSRYKGGGDKRRSDSSSYRDKRRDDDRPSRGGRRYGDKDNRGRRYEGDSDKRRSDSRSDSHGDLNEKRPFKKGGDFKGKPYKGDNKRSFKPKFNEGPKSKRDSKKVTVRFKRKRLD